MTRCEKWKSASPAPVDPCSETLAPDAISYFKKICLDSTVNFVIDDVLKAVLCYYDPCKGNGIGATVPLCSADPNDVFCWSYGFPKCWQRNSAGCYTACSGANKCCWRSRIYCVNPITGLCGLRAASNPNDWSCSTGECAGNCIEPSACTPTPVCSSCETR